MKVAFWNINGLGEKYKEQYFNIIINKYEIICLTETWGADGKISNFDIPIGYKAFHHNRRNKHKRAKRNSGGILILYKKELHNYLKIQNRENENILWIKVDKKLMATGRNLMLGTVYISPINFGYIREMIFY